MADRDPKPDDADPTLEPHLEAQFVIAMRREFIRRAAIAIYNALPFELTRARPVPECAAMCWKEARTLWDVKPEDC